jgi:hypothetical protein
MIKVNVKVNFTLKPAMKEQKEVGLRSSVVSITFCLLYPRKSIVTSCTGNWMKIVVCVCVCVCACVCVCVRAWKVSPPKSDLQKQTVQPVASRYTD